MLELMPYEYDAAWPMIENIEFDTVFAEAVIEGKQAGRIYADSRRGPSVVLILHHFGMSLLCGDVNNEDFTRNITGMLLKKGDHLHENFRLTVYPEEWNGKLERVLGDKLVHYREIEADKSLGTAEKADKLKLLSKDHVVQWIRTKMKFNEKAFVRDARHSKLPDGFALKKIDETLFGRINGTIVPKVFWDTCDSFLKNGIGYCLMQEDKIVSTSFSAYISGKATDIGVETSPEFRGKGLGIYPCAAMVEYCLENGLEPIWGCRQDNVSSSRLSRKLGFEERLFHPVYWPVSL